MVSVPLPSELTCKGAEKIAVGRTVVDVQKDKLIVLTQPLKQDKGKYFLAPEEQKLLLC